jgi:hypothetical protein
MAAPDSLVCAPQRYIEELNTLAMQISTDLMGVLPMPIPPLSPAGTPARQRERSIEKVYTDLRDLARMILDIAEPCPTAGGRRRRRSTRKKTKNN